MFKRVFQLSIFLIFLALFFYLNQPLLAQTEEETLSLGLSISPVTFDLSADPGDTLKNDFRIYNPTNQSVEAKITVEDFAPIGEEGFVEIIEPDLASTTSLASWVKIDKNNFFLEPREQKIISFSIDVPKDAEPGGKYSSLVVNIGGVSTETGAGGAALRQKIASLILLSVFGEVQEKLIINKFIGPEFQEYGPIKFNLYLENQGTVHLRPKGFITINDWSGKKVADLSISQTAVMPGARRTIETEWSEINLMGKFTATLIGSYGKTNQPFTATWDFWVWPWKLTLVILIIVVLLLILFIRSRKRIAAAFKILFKGDNDADSRGRDADLRGKNNP